MAYDSSGWMLLFFWAVLGATYVYPRYYREFWQGASDILRVVSALVRDPIGVLASGFADLYFVWAIWAIICPLAVEHALATAEAAYPGARKVIICGACYALFMAVLTLIPATVVISC
jgi:hypothetical protein